MLLMWNETLSPYPQNMKNVLTNSVCEYMVWSSSTTTIWLQEWALFGTQIAFDLPLDPTPYNGKTSDTSSVLTVFSRVTHLSKTAKKGVYLWDARKVPWFMKHPVHDHEIIDLRLRRPIKSMWLFLDGARPRVVRPAFWTHHCALLDA